MCIKWSPKSNRTHIHDNEQVHSNIIILPTHPIFFKFHYGGYTTTNHVSCSSCKQLAPQLNISFIMSCCFTAYKIPCPVTFTKVKLCISYFVLNNQICSLEPMSANKQQNMFLLDNTSYQVSLIIQNL